MVFIRIVASFAVVLFIPPSLRAGLYYSGESYAELPSQWRGFLLDQRMLRQVGIKPAGKTPVHPLRERYQQEAEKLQKEAAKRKLTADELADLGALYIRLGEAAKAVEILRDAQRNHPHHFHIAANLGTAWQLQGDLAQAVISLQQAVRLAPGKMQKAEEYHLKLVQIRQRRARDNQDLEDLVGVRYIGESGKYEPGKLAAAERKKLPAEAAAICQQLALWLPADGYLLWQLAELANAHGDIKTAAAMMDGCVTEFGMNAPELRRHRQLVRAAADELAKNSEPDLKSGLQASDAKTVHEGHAGILRPRSKRPLLSRLESQSLPAVKADGVNPLPWDVLAETRLDQRKFKPAFAKYLEELDGKQITLTGYMQPLTSDLEVSSFMLVENPIGCWYCEMPEIIGIILVDLPEGKSTAHSRGAVKVVGKLKLNGTDPENFLYIIDKAKVTESN